MTRTQIQFEDEQLEALRAEAARQNVSISELVRRAVATAGRTAARGLSEREVRQRALAVAGRFASGFADVAERHDDYLAEAFCS